VQSTTTSPFWYRPIRRLATAITFLFVIALAQLWVFVFIANVVVWLVWQHRAQANAQHLTTKKLTFSPGWAVGWWFVPFANLVQPFRAVRELWRASGGAGHAEESAWPALVLWWIAWLGFELLGSGAASANSASAIAAADERQLVAMLFGIASAALAIVIVRAVVRRQETRIKSWPEASYAQLPPPPPPNPLPE
jgi:hypothetical protein